MHLEKGCQVKLKKKEILKHEMEECRYRELQCPGCGEMVAGFVLPEHFKVCDRLQYEEHRQSMELNEEENEFWNFTDLTFIRPLVYKLENSKNWFILFDKIVGFKHVFFIMHFCGEKKETFNFDLKISGGSKVFSRSMIGRCTPFGMGVDEAIRMGYTLEIITSAMEEMCLVKNPAAGQAKYQINIMSKVMTSPK